METMQKKKKKKKQPIFLIATAAAVACLRLLHFYFTGIKVHSPHATLLRRGTDAHTHTQRTHGSMKPINDTNTDERK